MYWFGFYITITVAKFMSRDTGGNIDKNIVQISTLFARQAHRESEGHDLIKFNS